MEQHTRPKLSSHGKSLAAVLVALCLPSDVCCAESLVVSDEWSLEMFYNRTEDGDTDVTTVNYQVCSDTKFTKYKSVSFDRFTRASGPLKPVYANDNSAAIAIWPDSQTGTASISWIFETQPGKVFDAFTIDPASFQNATLSVRLNGRPEAHELLRATRRTSPGVIDLSAAGEPYSIGSDARRIELIAATTRTSARWYHTLMFRTSNPTRNPALSIRAWTCAPAQVGKTKRNASPDRSPEALGILRQLESISPESVVAALEHMASTWPDQAPVFRSGVPSDLKSVHGNLLRRLRSGDPTARQAGQSLTKSIRQALLSNPLVTAAPVLFVARSQYRNTHGPDETMYQTNEHVTKYFKGGGTLRVLDVSTGKVRTLLELPGGNVRDPFVHADGKRMLLSVRKDVRDNYHIYRMNADGTGLKQLTSAPQVTDIQPVWLPNGRIMFSSTREPKYIHCQRHLMANLFLMEEDGANIRQVGFNTLFEGRSSLLPDGRVLYSRWEYVDKHFSSAYGLWTAYPDGTQQQLYYGGLSWQPGAMLDARAIPGTRRLACIFGSVHGHENGAMVVVDPEVASEGPESILHTWPKDISNHMRKWKQVGRVGGGDYDSFKRGLPHFYQCPFPLSEHYYLCTRTFREGNRTHYGLFLADTFGNETLLHHEEPGCFQPVLLRPTSPLPVIPDRITDPGVDKGTFYVNDVYGGPEMAAVPRGTVKWLRVVEAPAKLTYPPGRHGDWAAPRDTDSHHPTALNWNHYNSKRVLGTVRVHPDGSSSFTVPARRFVYFQLLDATGRMVHSMRSGTALLPGEQQGCVGCHSYRSTPTASSPTIRRPPDALTPWKGGARVFNYAEHVQPILDKHCVTCHDHGKRGAKMNLSGDKGLAFNSSYVALMSRSPAVWKLPEPGADKPLVSTIGAGPVPSVPPRTWGSSQSRLIDMLEKGHGSVKLTPGELQRLMEWIDLNAPYYPFEQDYYTANTYGRSPLDHAQLRTLGTLIMSGPKGREWGWTSTRDYTRGALTSLFDRGLPPVNLTRPELSPCLQAFETPDAPGYAEALALIKAGQQMLEKHPRADSVSGFKPSKEDQERLDFYRKRREIEARNRAALLNGSRAYD